MEQQRDPDSMPTTARRLTLQDIDRISQSGMLLTITEFAAISDLDKQMEVAGSGSGASYKIEFPAGIQIMLSGPDPMGRCSVMVPAWPGFRIITHKQTLVGMPVDR